MYELNIQNYTGPLDKLLELIEEKKLAINDVSLAAVTDDFLKYLETLRTTARGADLAILADFIVVASRLLLIKSKSLLPELVLTPEEEHDIHDLENRLALYQRLKQVERHVDATWRNETKSGARTYFMGGVPNVFYPGENVTQENLLHAIRGTFESLEKFVLATETISETIVSLEEKMQDIIRRMEGTAETSLQTLGDGSRIDIILAFIAILHMAREQILTLEQESQFSDIIVRKK